MIHTRTRFVLVQHVLEVPKVSNTGRLAAEALANLERHVHGAPSDAGHDPGAWLRALEAEGTWLLFPGGPTGAPAALPARVVVLDASWSQARRMVQRLPALRALPRLSLEVPIPEPSLRRAPEGGLSTLQAIGRCVELLEGAETAAAVLALHRALVDRALAARGYL
jgi:DTW domain-containing protein YfiP